MAYRNVLIGVDLQPGSDDLLRHVARIAPDARLTALHAYQVPFEGTLRRAGVGEDTVERHRGVALKEALDRIAALGAGHVGNVDAISEQGDPARLLVDHARRMDADLIVVARRNRTPIESLLVGSVAARVVAEADRDVLVLRDPAAA